MNFNLWSWDTDVHCWLKTHTNSNLCRSERKVETGMLWHTEELFTPYFHINFIHSVVLKSITKSQKYARLCLKQLLPNLYKLTDVLDYCPAVCCTLPKHYHGRDLFHWCTSHDSIVLWCICYCMYSLIPTPKYYLLQWQIIKQLFNSCS